MIKEVPNFIKNIIDFKHDTIDYSKQKNISYSQFSMYNTCGHKWKLLYKDKLKKTDYNINLTFGTAIHETIQEFIKNLYNFKTIKLTLEFDYISYFTARYKSIYKETFEKNNNKHFTNKEQFTEYYDDGIEIINYFINNYKNYFSKKDEILIGIEYPIFKDLGRNNILMFNGFIDCIVYNYVTNKFRIIDFKTSKNSWGDYQKKDKNKINQLILYKYFIHKIHNIPLENIEVEFIILKRKLFENCDFKQKRLQSFIPAQINNVKKTAQELNDFLDTCYDNNGNFKDDVIKPNPGKFNCMFCQFKDDEKNCSFAHKE